MSGADLESGKTIQRSFEDEVREEYGGFQGVADRVAQPASSLQARILRRAGRAGLWVHEYDNTEFLGFGPERIELPVREFLAFNAASDGGAAHPEFSYRLVQLLRRQIRMLQRESGHSHESVRIPGAPLGDFFILQLDEVASQDRSAEYAQAFTLIA